MSKEVIEDAECIYCKKEFKIKFHEIFNYPLDKDSYDIITSFKDMIWECPYCHNKGFLDHKVLYNDTDKHFTVLYSKEQNDIKEFIKLNNSLDLDNINRVTTDYKDFIEKVMIFNLGLNDLAIEYCKINLAKQLVPKHIEKITFENNKTYGPIFNVKVRDDIETYAFDKQVYDIFYKKLTDLNLLNRKEDYIVTKELAFNINKGINKPLYKEIYNIK